MLEYLHQRTGAEKQPIPAGLKSLLRGAHPSKTAAVALRREGVLLVRVIGTEGNLPRSVISAAVRAMRTDRLPDRITPEVLGALTVEVEVVGPAEPVKVDGLPAALLPARLGLHLRRGDARSFVLPSEARLLRLDPQQMPLRCMRQLPTSKATLKEKPQWSVFATRHFVGHPGKPAVELYRGKVLLPPDAVVDGPAAPRRVAAYLMRKQDAGGRYRAEGRASAIREHLLATFALAALAAREKPDSQIVPSLKAATAFVRRSVRTGRAGAFVRTDDPADQLAATAWLAMTAGRLPKDFPTARMRDPLLSAIASAVADDGSVSCRLDGAKRQAASLRDACLALKALQGPSAPSAILERLRDYIAKATPADVVDRAWRIHTASVPPQTPKPDSDLPGRLPDQQGGLGPTGGEPTALLTMLWVTGHGKRDLPAARRFCLQLMYREAEAYFAKDPAAWTGAVRVSPAARDVSVESCAAAIEVFLAR